MVQLHIVGKNIEITPALKNTATEKMQILEKHYNHIHKINIVLESEHITQTAEATVFINGTEIHATARDEDMYKAIEMLASKLAGQITKHKEKLSEHHK